MARGGKNKKGAQRHMNASGAAGAMEASGMSSSAAFGTPLELPEDEAVALQNAALTPAPPAAAVASDASPVADAQELTPEPAEKAASPCCGPKKELSASVPTGCCKPSDSPSAEPKAASCCAKKTEGGESAPPKASGCCGPKQELSATVPTGCCKPSAEPKAASCCAKKTEGGESAPPKASGCCDPKKELSASVPTGCCKPSDAPSAEPKAASCCPSKKEPSAAGPVLVEPKASSCCAKKAEAAPAAEEDDCCAKGECGKIPLIGAFRPLNPETDLKKNPGPGDADFTNTEANCGFCGSGCSVM
ncbi:hypothetical protein DIPPA_21652 [Diplonema papillatum]|nr:hypothetical protein DIPPA_21652 [Diplonema papillatum]KAJ9443655.1 hypothetical protein DIPPA_21652 [Diplonema papillatum]KAJ9443657.1 hypothetical protein DIPPA_21652 [Diplonema papillatum]